MRRHYSDGFLQTLKDGAEYYISNFVLALLHRLGPERASNFGAAVARAVGPLLPASRVADENLRAVFPHFDDMARKRIIAQVWENLGRTVAELPHLSALELTESGPGFEIEGAEYLRPGPVIYVSGHYGNWEALPPIAARVGLPFSFVYRAAKNALVDRLIQSFRNAAINADVPMFPKGAAGARGALAHIARGGALGMLVDQKLNDGIEVPFLGLPAMTATAAAAFALRYRCPVIPGRVERIEPARLKMIVEPPLPLPETGDQKSDILTLTAAINAVLGRWIAMNPGAWLWLHRRWPRAVIAAKLAAQGS